MQSDHVWIFFVFVAQHFIIKPSVLTLNWTPAVLSPFPWAGYVAVFQPLSSEEVAGSLVLPVAHVAVVPPVNEAVPVPTDGRLVPVLVAASGGKLLKFH